MYINHELTGLKGKLLWLSKLLAKEYLYKFVCANENGINIRKAGGPIIKISTLSQLQRLDHNRKIQDLHTIIS